MDFYVTEGNNVGNKYAYLWFKGEKRKNWIDNEKTATLNMLKMFSNIIKIKDVRNINRVSTKSLPYFVVEDLFHFGWQSTYMLRFG